MFVNRMAYVEEFITKLHGREYIIDDKANDIQNGDKSLAEALSSALAGWEAGNSLRLTQEPYLAHRPFAVITAAFAHGVVIEKDDVRKKLQEAERRLQECESEKQSLQKDNSSLNQRLIQMKEINTVMENDLKKYEANSGDVNE